MRRQLLGLACLALGSWEAGAAPAEPDPAQLECLALNIYFEARSERPEEQAAVAHVTLNRVGNADFPDTVCGVVQQGGEDGGCQFAWWCDGLPDMPENEAAWREAQRVARAVMRGEIPDPTGGALYFHHQGDVPDWAAEKEQTAVLSPHVFYR